MAVTSQIITSKSKWETFLKKHPEANFLQSWDFGEFHKNLGHNIFRVGFFTSGKLDGVVLITLEKAKRATYLTIPAGPILDWKNKKIVALFKKEIIKIAKENSAVFIRVRPQLEANEFSQELFKKLGFRSAPMHLHAELTNQLDITQPEDQLLANMRKATRYEIRKAEKVGVRVEESTNPQDIKKFYNLQLDTARRQGFVPFSLPFLQEQFKVFADSGNAILYSAYFEKKLLAQAFIIFYGQEAVYHYGASTPDGREYPGAYLIQWKAILEAKKRKMERYNFWGVASNPNHRFANLSLFKRGFGGVDVAYLHAQDLIIHYPKYFINYVIEITRKKIRHV